MHKSIRKIVDGEHTGIVAKMSGGAPKVNSPAPPPARPLKAPASAAPDRSLEATAANVLARGGALLAAYGASDEGMAWQRFTSAFRATPCAYGDG